MTCKTLECLQVADHNLQENSGDLFLSKNNETLIPTSEAQSLGPGCFWLSVIDFKVKEHASVIVIPLKL